MAQIKNGVEKMVSIEMGYNSTILAPVSKAGMLLEILAGCQMCAPEWVGEREGKESTQVLIPVSRLLELKMGDFVVMSREEYEKARDEATAYRETQKQEQADAQ